MSKTVIKFLKNLLPTATMSQRLLAILSDLTLVFLLALFIIGKLWMPRYYADALFQFRILWETYASQLNAGQFSEFLKQVSNNANIMNMFASVDHLLLIITWSYFTVNALIFRGGSLGKQIFNLRVLKVTDGLPLSPMDCFLRSGILTLLLLSFWPFLMCFNLCFMCVDVMHRGIHDRICKTYVLNFRALEQLKMKLDASKKEDPSDQ